MPKPTAPPVRANKKNEPAIETSGQDITITIDTRRYRIRGLERNTSPHQLKVNVLATRDGTNREGQTGTPILHP